MVLINHQNQIVLFIFLNIFKKAFGNIIKCPPPLTLSDLQGLNKKQLNVLGIGLKSMIPFKKVSFADHLIKKRIFFFLNFS